MKGLQLSKLNRATYNLLLDVSPMVDQVRIRATLKVII